eukprot:3710438-Rhodomonas_salina.1
MLLQEASLHRPHRIRATRYPGPYLPTRVLRHVRYQHSTRRVSFYSPCSVLTSLAIMGIFLRTCYAMSGTDLAHGVLPGGV